MKDQSLYYGDCLDWMREWPSESVDLIYLDPPFNSDENYNILFGTGDGTPAQVRGFNDTWKWDEASADRVQRFENAVAHPLHDATLAFKRLLGPSGLLAYLTYMGERIAEMPRLLRPNGSIYLHCDPTASHYLKMLMDALFGAKRFRNEIVWERTLPKGLMTRRLPRSHDVVLGYERSELATWNNDAIFRPYDQSRLDEKTRKQYSNFDPDGRRYQLTSLLNPNKDRPNLTYEFLGVTKVWRWTKERMEDAYARGLVVQAAPGRTPRLKRYLDEQRGRPFSDVWTDIPPVSGNERLGYPTQKPLALLERIIRPATSPGDLVLDPFCGCGTAVIVAHNLGRRWIGVDISATAIDIIQERRLKPAGVQAETFGIPQDLESARKLAADKPLDFEAWAVTRISGFAPNERRTGDRGVDGRGMLIEKPTDRDSKLVLAQVKGGGFQIGQLRDFLHVIERDDAACGVFITVDPVTSGQARAEARGLGDTSVGSGRYPRAQLWSIADWFEGRRPHLPTLTDPQTGKPIQSSLLG